MGRGAQRQRLNDDYERVATVAARLLSATAQRHHPRLLHPAVCRADLFRPLAADDLSLEINHRRAVNVIIVAWCYTSAMPRASLRRFQRKPIAMLQVSVNPFA